MVSVTHDSALTTSALTYGTLPIMDGSLWSGKEPAGRKLDFLCQELNREANTLGSKGANVDLANAAIELKLLIEQIREQVQNIE